MTRFLMSLAGVGRPGRARVPARRAGRPVRPQGAGVAPSTTWPGRRRLFGEDEPEIQVIGTRHGEKLHETLLSREEMVKAEDQGDYFRVPLDAAVLEYELYFEEGERRRSTRRRLHLRRTPTQLDVEQTEELLLHAPRDRALDRELRA